MTAYHILNGDCLAEQLRETTINQNYIICRECFIEGEVNNLNLADFWKIRAEFIAKTYKISIDEYFNTSLKEFEKINDLPENAEVCLWFENDLFCQSNMWFVISMLAHKPTINLYRVFPIIEKETNFWKGFGVSNTEMLEKAYQSKIRFTSKDISLGENLWRAYQKADFNRLKVLSKTKSNCFQYLPEVCQAHIDRFSSGDASGRPERVIKEIIDTEPTDFQAVFSKFSSTEGIYGFGDLQVKKLYDTYRQQLAKPLTK